MNPPSPSSPCLRSMAIFLLTRLAAQTLTPPALTFCPLLLQLLLLFFLFPLLLLLPLPLLPPPLLFIFSCFFLLSSPQIRDSSSSLRWDKGCLEWWCGGWDRPREFHLFCQFLLLQTMKAERRGERETELTFSSAQYCRSS